MCFPPLIVGFSDIHKVFLASKRTQTLKGVIVVLAKQKYQQVQYSTYLIKKKKFFLSAAVLRA
jgi:hypothetical protein